MVCLHPTRISLISRRRLSYRRQGRRPPSSSVSLPSLEVEEVRILHETFMVLQRGSTQTRAITVSVNFLGYSLPFFGLGGGERSLLLLTAPLDIVGNNIPVFFIQDAILFPDLVHAAKPSPNNEIPQAATAHDSAWDFFSQQPSTLHTLFWVMAGHGIPRSFRHIDGFGVHTFRFVTDTGASKLVKFRWTSLQGKASLVWEEAQQAAGKNADYDRQDLYNAIQAGRFPEWEVRVS